MVIFLWILLYGLLFFSGELLSNYLAIKNSVTAIIVLVYAICLVIFSGKSKYKKFCYAFKLKIKFEDLVYFLPLIIFPIANLFIIDFVFNVHFFVLTIGVCIVEEVFFRGYLLIFLTKCFGKAGIIYQSILFSLLHFVNLFNNTDIIWVLFQVISAFSIGLCFGYLANKFRSLLPGTISHIAVNFTAMGVVGVSKQVYYIVVASCTVLLCLYGIFLLFKSKQKIEE